jgi:hypothetical protein
METVQGSQCLHFSVFHQNANHLRLMDQSIIGDFPHTEPTLFL